MQPPDWVWYMIPIICFLWVVEMALRLYIMRLKRKLAEAGHANDVRKAYASHGISI